MNNYLPESLLVAFAVLQVADSITTSIGIRYGAAESNPLGKWLFERIGVTLGLTLMKLVAIAVSIWFYYTSQQPVTILMLVDIAYLVIVANNLIVIGKLTPLPDHNENHPSE